MGMPNFSSLRSLATQNTTASGKQFIISEEYII